MRPNGGQEAASSRQQPAAAAHRCLPPSSPRAAGLDRLAAQKRAEQAKQGGSLLGALPAEH